MAHTRSPSSPSGPLEAPGLVGREDPSRCAGQALPGSTAQAAGPSTTQIREGREAAEGSGWEAAGACGKREGAWDGELPGGGRPERESAGFLPFFPFLGSDSAPGFPCLAPGRECAGRRAASAPVCPQHAGGLPFFLSSAATLTACPAHLTPSLALPATISQGERTRPGPVERSTRGHEVRPHPCCDSAATWL